MGTTVRTLACLALLVGAGGCASVSDWAGARARDLGDCVRGSVGLSGGLYVEAEATAVLNPSAGFGDFAIPPKWTLAWDPRPLPPGRVRTSAFPTLLVGWPFYRHEMIAMGYADSSPGWRGFLAPFFLVGSDHSEGRGNSLLGMHALLPNPLLVEARAETPTERLSRQSWVGGSATVGIIGVDAGINPLEIVDFLVGLFGWDLLEDDDRAIEPPLEAPVEAIRARVPPGAVRMDPEKEE